MSKRPDPTPYQCEGIMLPTLGGNASEWRRELKLYLLRRDRICMVCGKPICSKDGFDLHEAIITREYVSKWPLRWKKLIHCELNCLLLHRGKCHDFKPKPDDVWERHCLIYGEDVMVQWATSLPFKGNPLQGLIDFALR